MFQDFKSEIKLFLIVAAVSAVLAVGGILLIKTMQPAPIAQIPPPPEPSPQPQTEVLDASDWQTYRNAEFGFEVRYPSHWKLFDASLEGGYVSKGYRGEDGFFQFQAIEDEISVDIDELSQYVAYFDESYGSKPVIENLKIEGQEARLILPSDDQSKDMKNQSALVIRYPKPIVTQENTYGSLLLLIDKDHINQILSTFRFVE